MGGAFKSMMHLIYNTHVPLVFSLVKHSPEAALGLPESTVGRAGVVRATCVKTSISKDSFLHKYPLLVFPAIDNLAGLLCVRKLTQRREQSSSSSSNRHFFNPWSLKETSTRAIKVEV